MSLNVREVLTGKGKARICASGTSARGDETERVLLFPPLPRHSRLPGSCWHRFLRPLRENKKSHGGVRIHISDSPIQARSGSVLCLCEFHEATPLIWPDFKKIRSTWGRREENDWSVWNLQDNGWNAHKNIFPITYEMFIVPLLCVKNLFWSDMILLKSNNMNYPPALWVRQINMFMFMQRELIPSSKKAVGFLFSTHLQRRWACQCALAAAGLSEPSGSGCIGSKPQRDTDTRAPWTRTRSISDKPAEKATV